MLLNKVFISIGFKNLLRFLFGLILLAIMLAFIIDQNPRILLFFGIIFLYLLTCIILFTFSYIRVSDGRFFVKGDFTFIKSQQIQKKSIFRIEEVLTVSAISLKDHTNSNGESIPYKFKYGNERMFIYGFESLECIYVKF